MSAKTRLAQAVWFWRAAGFRTKLDQNSSIVPIEHRPQAPHKTPPHLEMDAVASRTDRKSTRLNSSHLVISYAVFCLKKKNTCTVLYHYNLSIITYKWLI